MTAIRYYNGRKKNNQIYLAPSHSIAVPVANRVCNRCKKAKLFVSISSGRFLDDISYYAVEGAYDIGFDVEGMVCANCLLHATHDQNIILDDSNIRLIVCVEELG